MTSLVGTIKETVSILRFHELDTPTNLLFDLPVHICLKERCDSDFKEADTSVFQSEFRKYGLRIDAPIFIVSAFYSFTKRLSS